MTDRPLPSTRQMAIIGCALLLASCGSTGSGGGGTGGRGETGGQTGSNGTGGTLGTGGTNGSSGTGGESTGTGGTTTGTGGTTTGTGGTTTGTGGDGPVNGTGGTNGGGGDAGGRAGGGNAGGGGGSAGRNGVGGQPVGTGGAGGGVMMGSCMGKMVPTADPTAMGTFPTATDKNVGPLTGATPDPIHGDMQSRFNVYRPKDLVAGGYCFPIVIWSNGHGDQPEPSPPECVLNSCGHYATVMQQFASHGFVVVVSLSSTTSKGDPPPSAVGLDWILKQAEDPMSPYYHHLDTTRIGAAGHSEGGAATSKLASDPHISAISSVSGPSANPMIHQPALLFVGGMEGGSIAMNATNVVNSITQYPAMFINNLNANHVSWSSQGIKGPTISGLIAWFRVHLMNDTANRKYFYGVSCTFCTDSKVMVLRNNLLMQ